MNDENTSIKIAGIIRRVLFSNPESGFVILDVAPGDGQTGVVVLGEAAGAEVGESLYAEGSWQFDKAWGKRLKASLLRLSPPSGAAAIEQYLAGGRISGIGKALAKRLRERFGDKLEDILTNHPERLAEVRGISAKMALAAGDAWGQRQKSRELIMFLQGHGLSGNRAQRIIDVYGEDTVEKVMADPYRLARDIRGIGFQTADMIALDLGLERSSIERVRAALVQSLKDAENDGHTALPLARLLDHAQFLLGLDLAPLEGLADAALAEKSLFVCEEIDGTAHVFQRRLADLEKDIARELFKRLDARMRLPESHERIERAIESVTQNLAIDLHEDQRDAVEQSISYPVFLLTGGPGTGKTTILRAVLTAFTELGRTVALAAPTGRAAKRLSESTGDEAKTLHRLLEAEPDSGFRRNRTRRLEVDALIVDEASMIDVYLMHGLIEALPDDAALILVGDAQQLPPVGPGAVLKDLLSVNMIPSVTLSHIFRQAAGSAIVRNAHSINSGVLPVFSKDDEAPDMFGVRAQHAEDAIEKVVELVTNRIPRHFGFDPLDDIQVLTPINRGAVGTEGLNAVLQKKLNPNPRATVRRGDRTFAAGDKVMQTENDYNREIYNGDVGRITDVDTDADILTVRFDSGLQSYSFEELHPLVPAYAITVHKSQGSEYRAVVILLLRQHGRMLRRNLLYTGVTRGRELVVVVTDDQALSKAVSNPGDENRISFLAKRLMDLQAAET